jgi:hypothetical protein
LIGNISSLNVRLRSFGTRPRIKISIRTSKPRANTGLSLLTQINAQLQFLNFARRGIAANAEQSHGVDATISLLAVVSTAFAFKTSVDK